MFTPKIPLKTDDESKPKYVKKHLIQHKSNLHDLRLTLSMGVSSTMQLQFIKDKAKTSRYSSCKYRIADYEMIIVSKPKSNTTGAICGGGSIYPML